MGMGKKLYILISGIVVVILIVFITLWIYFKPFVFVSIDVNPSVELSVNKFGRVIDVEAKNDQGLEILEEIEKDLKNETIEDAVTSVIDVLINEGYFNIEDTADIIVAAYSKDIQDADALIVKLKELIKNKIESEGYFARIDGITVGREVFEEAEDMGVSPGKLDLIQDVIENSSNQGSTRTVEDLIDMPVNEIINLPDDGPYEIEETEDESEEEHENESEEDDEDELEEDDD